MSRRRFRCGMPTRCGRPTVHVGSGAAVSGLAWYECPPCRRSRGDVSESSAWPWSVCDINGPDDATSFTDGFSHSRSAAVRSMRREIARRTAR